MSSDLPDVVTSEDFRDLQKELSKDLGLVWGSDDSLKLRLLPLGIAAFDYALDGGLAFGRVIEFVGEYGSGKTLLSLIAIREAQKQGISCVFIDVERSWNPDWASQLGVDIDSVAVMRPASGEAAWDAVIKLCRAGVGLVVVDSLAEMAPTKEVESDSIGDNLPAIQARMNSRAMRNVKPAIGNTIVILINQLREKVGVMFGDPRVLPGGKTTYFGPWQIVMVKRGPWHKDGETKIGYDLSIEVTKNKQGAPYKTATVPFYFTGELDETGSLVSLAIDIGLISKEGARYEIAGVEGSIYGMKKLLAAVKESPELIEKLNAGVKALPEMD